ncbi:MAG TPA: hypothetical protein VMM57_04980 [Bacteroidota bacterium]|nr:hypothetical protein [Bacteroidota bacterium]
MSTPLYYIIPDLTVRPFLAEGFSAFMDSDKGTTFVPCWRNEDKALSFLRSRIRKDVQYGVVSSTIELLQQKMQEKLGMLIEIRFMD